jgi:GntR family transcriptional regulator
VLSVSDLEAQGGRDADLAYLRVADDIAARIASGELAPGARLRGERDLATYYEVSYGTVRRAMEVLRERGLIETIHGRGTFVRRDQGWSLPSRCGDRRYSGFSGLIMPNTCRNRPEQQDRRPH